MENENLEGKEQEQEQEPEQEHAPVIDPKVEELHRSAKAVSDLLATEPKHHILDGLHRDLQKALKAFETVGEVVIEVPLSGLGAFQE